MMKRADLLVVEKGLCPSRTLAQRMIREGKVLIDGKEAVRKTSQLIEEDAELAVTEMPRYVSRGAFKLLAALEAFHPDVDGRIVLDLGASTGGFTDVMLQHGAAKVYAVDVGVNQLHEKLRGDSRVISLEKTNARNLNREIIPDMIDILVGDVSFISLTKVLTPCAPLLADGAWIMVLIKPQFEAGRDDVGSGGIVRSESVRQRCVRKIVAFAESELHWHLAGVVPSPIKGGDGNQEYVAAFRKIGPDGFTPSS